MTTPRDLLIVALDAVPDRPVESGDLSLALAGAEVIDLLAARALTLDGEHIVPGNPWPSGDRLLDEAASSSVRQVPYESVDDWLWRRGRGLSTAYRAAMEEDGQLTRQRRRWALFETGHLVPADSPARRRAADRWTSHEPVLAALAAALGIGGRRTMDDAPAVADDAVVTVLIAVHNAVRELEAVRQRRAIEQDAFDNVWRG
ncbi:GPP34 family phosphoprotein [Streptomyces sp. NA02536]|uniref:GOLPH3/VPS74 family protein n=1 Tax=Streptomyces sp. NA02536 TaxID=2742133 RepID=UPI001590CAC5|nr:GPP34 family phosphoprotein [Streptomyces sp. NA02536]QKW04401.1 GPP34 family phosphoprotein [Streptomyces sp. NA02536]